MTPKLSIFASAIRPHLWEDLLKSLRGSKYEYELIFAGHVDQSLVIEMFSEYPEFKYITTGECKPSQCYEIARRACTGELIHWTADDAVYSEGFVNRVYDFYKNLCETTQSPIIISCKTNENGMNETMLNHRFFGRNQNTPIMCPLGVASREYIEYLGGLDTRYISGQWENDILCRAYANGAKTYIQEDICISIEHANKHGKNNNFWSGYNEDREQLENSWCVGGYQQAPKPLVVLDGLQPPYTYWPICNTEFTLERNDEFHPYPKDISLTESIEPRGIWK